MRAPCTQILNLVICVPIILFTFHSSLLGGVERNDNQEFATLLDQASDEARELAIDAEEMQTLIESDQNWLTHKLKLAKVKGHVDNMSLIVDKLTRVQKSGSELQQQALERILPMVKELQSNTTAAMNYLDQNKERPGSATFKQYLERNAQSAQQLASIISALDDYERSMAEINGMRSKLSASETAK